MGIPANYLISTNRSTSGLQLGGNEPKVLNQATKIASKFAYDEVNLNCGCPSSRVLAGNFGVALMRTPAVVADCIKAMKDGSDVRVSIKHRIGIDDNKDYEFVRDFVGKFGMQDVTCFMSIQGVQCQIYLPKK